MWNFRGIRLAYAPFDDLRRPTARHSVAALGPGARSRYIPERANIACGA